MKMGMLFSRCCLAFAFVLVLSQTALAQTRVFISGFGNGNIVRYDVGTDTTTVVHSSSSTPSERPEDLVVGPDGKVYICDSLGNRIFRMNQDGSQFELVYSVPVVAPAPVLKGPEGPSFIGTDLYVNTRSAPHNGIWKFSGVASVPSGGVMPVPVQVLSEIETASAWGEGTTFTRDGTLLIVDRTNKLVLKSLPPYASTAVLISGLDVPIGIDVNSAGQIAVSDFGTKSIKRYTPDGAFLAEILFTAPEGPWFLEFDSADNLYVVTAETNQATVGKLYKIDTAGVKTLLTSSTTTAPDYLANAIGLAVRDQRVVTSGPKTFSPTQTTQTFERDPGSGGGFFATLTFPGGVLTTFDVEVFFVTVDQALENLRLVEPTFPAGTTCVTSNVPADRGGCIRYAFRFRKVGGGVPLIGFDFKENFRLELGFHTDDIIVTPGIAQARSTMVTSPIDFYDRDILVGFKFGSCNCVGIGVTDGFSDFLNINVGGTGPAATFPVMQVPLPPLRSDGLSVIKSGRALPVRFSITAGPGGAPITDAIAFFSVQKVAELDGTALVPIEVNTDAIGPSTGTQFIYNGAYQFIADTKGWPAGFYIGIITFAPSSPIFPGLKIRLTTALFDFAVRP